MILIFLGTVNTEGGGYSLKCIFHLKDEKVRIFNPSLKTLELNTDIVYARGSAAPFMPLSPLKEQKFSQESKSPIYRLVDSYCIISFLFYFIMSGIVFVFVYFGGTVLFSYVVNKKNRSSRFIITDVHFVFTV